MFYACVAAGTVPAACCGAVHLMAASVPIGSEASSSLERKADDLEEENAYDGDLSIPLSCQEHHHNGRRTLLATSCLLLGQFGDVLCQLHQLR
jgi:hypothetical protein